MFSTVPGAADDTGGGTYTSLFWRPTIEHDRRYAVAHNGPNVSC